MRDRERGQGRLGTEKKKTVHSSSLGQKGLADARGQRSEENGQSGQFSRFCATVNYRLTFSKKSPHFKATFFTTDAAFKRNAGQATKQLSFSE